MKFYYLIAAYNEELILERTVKELESLVQRHPGSEVFILVNGSGDRTWEIAQDLEKRYSPWVKSFHNKEKGMGVAYRRGLLELQKRNLDSNSWAVLTASDLPFGFTDLDSFLQLQRDGKVQSENTLFIGSKRHPLSKVERNWKRQFGSMIFELARFVLLGIKTKDTQGTLFLRGDQVGVVGKLQADDYFVTVEIVYYCERKSIVTEMPVELRTEMRSSKVSLLKDGYKSLRQVLLFRQRL